MKPDLQALINEWKNKSYLREYRKINILESPLVLGELYIDISIGVNLTVASATDTIMLREFLYTQENNNDEINSSGDCYRLKRVLSKITADFSDQYEITLKKMIEEQFGN